MSGAGLLDPGATKASRLAALVGRLRCATTLPMVAFSAGDWAVDPDACVSAVVARLGEGPLAVRSSARGEDGAAGSQAGRYTTVLDVTGRAALAAAAGEVIASFGPGQHGGDEVLVQPMLTGVTLSGVAFTADPSTGSPYRVVNHTAGGDTTRVTSGRGPVRTWVGLPDSPARPPVELVGVLALLDELESLLPGAPLDVEFAVAGGQVVLLQVRPLVLPMERPDPATHRRALAMVADRVAQAQRPHPFVHGRAAVFGVMPDWNPAEIIGVRPRPLALSLYKELVTDSTWAYQRDNYGYRSLRSHPLLLHFHGLPYVDVRASFNSFVPADIEASLAARLVDHYTEQLVSMPSLHDKIEFEIVFSCYTLDLPERLERLGDHGFSPDEQHRLADSLRTLTNRVIDPENGLWRRDEARLDTLVERHRQIMAADFEPVERIYWLLEDCKRWGTLPFAGLARAGFMAIQMLRSFVAVGVFDGGDYDAFLGGLDTISRQLSRDLAQLDRSTFLAKYGHLRPGTYDLLSPRYDEEPERYLAGAGRTPVRPGRGEPFSLTLPQLRRLGSLLAEHGLNDDVVGLLEFLQAGVELRERAKFLFTRSLSDALSLLRDLGRRHGFDADDMSYADVRVVHSLHASCADPGRVLARSIEQGRDSYEITRTLWLPPLVTGPRDVWGFEVPESDPNFVTQGRVTGRPARPEDDDLAGTIVCIPSADPGFDWLFSRPIAGLVTAYGGVNSHMAIRAGELGLPAVVGAGEAAFGRWAGAALLEIDCAARRVEVLA